ncbi:hypothetical protein CaCOL14_003727 [Colletotrichum acutatum]
MNTISQDHEQELLALTVALLYPWHITRKQADLVHWIRFFDQTNSDSGARNRRCVFGVKSGGQGLLRGPFIIGPVSYRKLLFCSISRQYDFTQDKQGLDDWKCTRSGMQLRCLTPSIGVSQQWKCQSESQIQVPGRTGEGLPIEERLPLPYRPFPAIPQS